MFSKWTFFVVQGKIFKEKVTVKADWVKVFSILGHSNALKSLGIPIFS